MVVEQGKQNMSGTPLTPPETAASPLSSPPLPFSLSPFLPCSSAPLPLSGRAVLVTRPGEQAQELRELLTALGAEVLEQPGITVSDPPDWSPVDTALEHLASYDWLVFSSSNGVKRLLDRLLLRGGSLEQLAKVKLAAIGPGTAAELVRYGLAVDVVPPEYRAEALAEALAPHAAGKRFLLARASRGRQVLPEQLLAAGGIVEQVVVYSTTDVEAADPQVAAALAPVGSIGSRSPVRPSLGRSSGCLASNCARPAWPASVPSPRRPCAS